MYEVSPKEHPCPICGQSFFDWGLVHSSRSLYYRPGFRRLSFGHAPEALKARRCLTCGHVQFFAEEELTRERNRSDIRFGLVWLALLILLIILVVVFLT